MPSRCFDQKYNRAKPSNREIEDVPVMVLVTIDHFELSLAEGSTEEISIVDGHRKIRCVLSNRDIVAFGKSTVRFA